MADYLTRDQVAEKFGFSKRKTKALFRLEGFPQVRIGDTEMVRVDRLDDWFREHEGEKLILDYTNI